MEQKSNSSLMKKTKAELVSIILRKDEREKELLSQISTDKTKDTTILQQKDEINRLKDELDNKKKTNKIKKKTNKTKKKSIDTIAKEVINGKWGNGDTRKKKLKAAGYDYAAVQKKVNELL